ncbi:hypothetical protein ACMZ7I_07115 [Gardnerella vaginalis]|uniref:hypothetical protein n=1 Tax=Gardnerella vaginalis TaxID=2702 RepID=UPI0039F0C4C4
MSKDKLTEALARLKKANEKYTQLQKGYDSARAECQPLTHARAVLDKANRKHEEALDKWRELDKQFDDEHARLIYAIDEARDEWWKEKQRVNEIIRKLTEANND